ncbi:hypothetical protein [Thermococcus prieurii]
MSVTVRYPEEDVPVEVFCVPELEMHPLENTDKTTRNTNVNVRASLVFDHPTGTTNISLAAYF